MPFLDWVNKSQATQVARDVPYHLIKPVSAHGTAEGEASDNLLIQGDNLLALNALLPFYRGRVKCIFIDPPYNTQSAFEHYDDKLEHSQWLSMMYPRLVLLRDLLAENGSIWITLDDNEAHYCKVLMDEVFGRVNFVRNITWQKKYTVASDSKGIPDSHDHILVFKKSKAVQRNLLERTEKQNGLYKYDDHDGRGPWRTDNLSVKTYSKDYDYPILNEKTGREYFPPSGRCWMTSKENMKVLIKENRIYWGKNGDGAPQLKRYLYEVQQGVVPTSWWPHDEVGHNDESRKEQKVFFGNEAFSTPKPERLLQRIIHIATNPGDLVLDSFLGSGTTAAVAHKMGRRYIGIEMGEHAVTHCLPRLQKVIEGEQGGISKDVGWQGGGGFRFCTLGSPVFDEYGGIHSGVRFGTLASYIWHFETGHPGKTRYTTPHLGVHNGVAYYLLFNGILGDRHAQSGNVLTHAMLSHLQQIHPHTGPKVVYGEMSRIGSSQLSLHDITFKQIPYDIPMR